MRLACCAYVSTAGWAFWGSERAFGRRVLWKARDLDVWGNERGRKRETWIDINLAVEHLSGMYNQ